MTSDASEANEVKDIAPTQAFRNNESPVRRSKMRPLSEPIICPTEVIFL